MSFSLSLAYSYRMNKKLLTITIILTFMFFASGCSFESEVRVQDEIPEEIEGTLQSLLDNHPIATDLQIPEAIRRRRILENGGPNFLGGIDFAGVTQHYIPVDEEMSLEVLADILVERLEQEGWKFKPSESGNTNPDEYSFYGKEEKTGAIMTIYVNIYGSPKSVVVDM